MSSSGQQYNGEIGVHVYMAIDISGSMQGEKIDQVSKSMQEHFNTTPEHVNFTIEVFNRTIQPFFIGNRSATRNIAQNIRHMCQGATALYDAVGQLVTNIPPKICSSEFVHLVLLSDGEDNASKHFTHDSIKKIVREKARANPNFYVNFLQIGPQTGVFKSFENLVPPAQSNVMSVPNSSAGVKIAMASVQRNIMMSSNRVNAIRSGGNSQTQAQAGFAASPNKLPTIRSGVAVNGVGSSSVKPIMIPSIPSAQKNSSSSKARVPSTIPAIKLAVSSSRPATSGTGQKPSSRSVTSSQSIQPIKIPQITSRSSSGSRFAAQQMSSLSSGIQA